MDLHKGDEDFEKQISIRKLTAESIPYFFAERGSGFFKCSLCGAACWHSDAIAHALWHALSNHRTAWMLQDAMEPNDKQYVVIIEYCNGRFRAPQKMLSGRTYVMTRDEE